MEDLKKVFKTENSVLHFLIMSVVTGFFYYVHWTARFLEIAQTKYEINEAVIKKASNLLWAYAVTVFIAGILTSIWGVAVTDRDLFRYNGDISILSELVSLVSVIIVVFLAMNLRNILIEILKKQGIEKNINIFLTCFFNVFYIYYILNKYDSQPNKPSAKTSVDITEQLEKLNTLKEKGALSEEEFEAEKKKLLASS